MKTLILYRSYYGNTKQVAEAIAQQITMLGHQSSIQDIRLRFPDLQGVDAIIVGAPTRMGRVTRKAKSVLRHDSDIAFNTRRNGKGQEMV